MNTAACLRGQPDLWVVRNVGLWLRKEPDEELVSLLGENIDYFKGCLQARQPNLATRSMIRMVQGALMMCDSSSRYRLTSLLKRLMPRLPAARLFACGSRDFCEEFTALKGKARSPGIDWNGHPAVISISHDIDYLHGFDFALQMARSDKEFGVPSVFNVLTHGDYALTGDFLDELRGHNAEIGLHGTTHDIGFGYLARPRIEAELRAALERLPIRVLGFRAPALSFSPGLASALDASGFEYDSSFRAFDKKTGQVKVLFPFTYPSVNLWEFPVTIQDSDLFRDLRLSDEESLALLKRLIEKTLRCGGMAVLNFHPCIMRGKVSFYLRFLEYLNEVKKQGAWLAAMGEVARFLKTASL